MKVCGSDRDDTFLHPTSLGTAVRRTHGARETRDECAPEARSTCSCTGVRGSWHTAKKAPRGRGEKVAELLGAF